MAKTPNLKKNRINISVRSRAARRNLESPPPDISTLKPNLSYDKTPGILAPHISGGITKKKPHSKVLSRKQRMRVEAGKEKGDSVRERTSVKILDSVGRSQRRDKRRKDWDDTNHTIQKELDTELHQPLGSGSHRGRRKASISAASTADQPDEAHSRKITSEPAQELAQETAELSL